MAHDRSPTTAEGELLRRARNRVRPKISIGAAAKRAGMSADNWGHNERGYQSTGRDQRRPVVPDSFTLAHMAKALEIAPEELEAIGRQDAANALRELQPRQATLAVTLPALEANIGGTSEAAREVLGELRAKAHSERRSLGEVLVEEGLAKPDELIVPDALEPDPFILEIGTLDIPDDMKDRMVRMYLENRAWRFEEARLERKRLGGK